MGNCSDTLHSQQRLNWLLTFVEAVLSFLLVPEAVSFLVTILLMYKKANSGNLKKTVLLSFKIFCGRI